MATDWKNLPATLDNALKALDTMTGDPDAAALIRNTLTFQHNERRRLEADNARLRTGDGAPRTGESKHLTVSAGDGSYSREQPMILMSWTCAICGKSHQREQLPGNTPRYCLPSAGEKQSDCQREATRRRVAAHRRKRKAGKPTTTPVAEPVTQYAKPVTDKPSFLLKRKHLSLLKKADSRDGQHYIGREGSKSLVLAELVAAGLARVVRTEGRRTYYALTEDGREAAKRKAHELAM